MYTLVDPKHKTSVHESYRKLLNTLYADFEVPDSIIDELGRAEIRLATGEITVFQDAWGSFEDLQFISIERTES